MLNVAFPAAVKCRVPRLLKLGPADQESLSAPIAHNNVVEHP